MNALVLSSALIVAASVSVQVSAGGEIEDAIAATFKIANPTSTATSFLVAIHGDDDGEATNQFVVTAAHVFEQMTGETSQLVVRMESRNGTKARQDVSIRIRENGAPLWHRHPKFDIAVLVFQPPVGLSLAAIPFDALAEHAPDVAEAVWVPSFPVQLEADPAGSPILRHGTTASPSQTPSTEHPTFLVDIASFAGDSGAPIIHCMPSGSPQASKSQPACTVLGLVIGLHRETTRTTTPHEERTEHRSLDLAIAVHATFIRETIERADSERQATDSSSP